MERKKREQTLLDRNLTSKIERSLLLGKAHKREGGRTLFNPRRSEKGVVDQVGD